MSNLDSLYQEIILEHNRRPRNFRVMEGADRVVQGRNPLCGDALTLWLKFDGDLVTDASFQGSGCAISKASASLMTEAVRGKTRGQAQQLFERFHELVTGKLDIEADPEAKRALGSLRALGGVAKFPVRVKCASMAWHALRSALGAVPQSSTGAPTADAFETVAEVADLPEGSLLAVRTARGDDICLFNYRGTIGAVHNVCTHAEFPMSDGTLTSDGCLECVWHGARYSCLTGEVRRGPAIDPLPVYEVRVLDGKIQVGGRKS
jgi:nitrogen fixation protein NifU and related proteins